MTDLQLIPAVTKPTRTDNQAMRDPSQDTKENSSEADFDTAYAAESSTEETLEDMEQKAPSSVAPDEPAEDLVATPAVDEDPDTATGSTDADPSADMATTDVPKAAKLEDQGVGATTSVTTKPRVETSELAFAQRVTTAPRDVKEASTTAVDPSVKATPQAAVMASVAPSVPREASTPDAAPSTAKAVSTATPAATQTLSAQPVNPLPTAPTSIAKSISGERNAEGDERRLRRVTTAELHSVKTTSASSAPLATKPPLTVTPSALQQSGMPLTVQADAAGPELSLSAVGDLDLPSSWEARSTNPNTLAQTLARSETPGMIGRQMAEALQRLPDRPVEVSLNPRELGRVRMNIMAAEAGITVQITAERPETLDLMRRNIDQLGQEFKALGYENINFAFNEGQSGSEQQTTDNDDAPSFQPSRLFEDAAEPEIPITLTPATGVDLRL
ncbi:flagellar hook-length control protein FliK [uncultured Roseobacter sp.]|uniref:flagellar hook-length control protein FliK n=1 Tax=uncultured Roseobacter sp. TaxID=114847 RepID=UPI00263284CA|nr:flagellar hook-length control protein FliK [uncultured Roseobacter sp.]